MNVRKINAMHSKYGMKSGCFCRDCDNLIAGYYHDKKYKKCLWYGASHSEATDWAFSYTACGKFNIPFDESRHIPLMQTLKHEHIPESRPINGQISLF